MVCYTTRFLYIGHNYDINACAYATAYKCEWQLQFVKCKLFVMANKIARSSNIT